MNKRGFFMETRGWISLIVGLLLLAVGLIPLLSHLSIIPFGLPGFMNNIFGAIFAWVIAVAALYILVDGIIEPSGNTLHLILIGLGIVFLVVGLFPILKQFGVIGFSIPFLSNLIVYNVIITIEGLMLVVGGLTMR